MVWTGVVMAAVGEVAGERDEVAERGGRDFPLGLGRQPLAGPAGEGVGLVEADVRDRLGGIDPALAGQGEDAPLAVLDAPVERRFPALLLHDRPAVGQPEFGPAVAAVG